MHKKITDFPPKPVILDSTCQDQSVNKRLLISMSSSFTSWRDNFFCTIGNYYQQNAGKSGIFAAELVVCTNKKRKKVVSLSQKQKDGRAYSRKLKTIINN